MTAPAHSDGTLADAKSEPLGSEPAAVEFRQIVKRYGHVIACDHVDLTVHRGRIHGLLGQNGAGKSTLMKILTGVVPADAGTIAIDGTTVAITDPYTAGSLGIAMVHQHYSVIDALTVWENVTLGEKGRLDQNAAVRLVEDLANRYGLSIDPYALVGTLTAGQRQRVEILKCLGRSPSILVLDEPTSVLTMAESDELFCTLRSVVTEERRAVVLISHKLAEILNATDEVTIMRDGAVVDRLETASTDARTLARGMVGREVSLRGEGAAFGLLDNLLRLPETARADHTDVENRRPMLEIRDAVVNGRKGHRMLDALSLDVKAGEIMGLAGVEGNGQVALANVLSSLVALDEGSVTIDGLEVRTGRAGNLAHAGVSVVPEDRHVAGCFLTMSVAQNLVFNDLDSISKRGVLSRAAIRSKAQRLVEQYDIKTSSLDAPMSSLSGGNQQRVVLARAMAGSPKVLVAAQPTRGLDVAAVEYVSDQLVAAARAGVAVLLISSELEEILALSNRIAVIHEGRIMGLVDRSDADLDGLGLMMGGHEP